MIAAAKGEIFSNDFPKYCQISGILQYQDSNNSDVGNNVSGKMKSREIFTGRLDFLLASDCIRQWAAFVKE